MSMRPYQQNAIDRLRDAYAAGKKKILLVLATGGGKTHIFSDVIKRTTEKGNYCVLAVRGRKLVDQASKRLDREGVDHGIIMGNHWRSRPGARVQVCSIDTLHSRNAFPKADLLVLDEAHLMVSDKCIEFINYYTQKGTYIFSVTATPFVKVSLRHLADDYIKPITMREMIDQNYLVPARYFAPSEPDLTGVKIQNGDYNQTQLAERMDKIIGKFVEHWQKFAENRSTLVFAVDVEHSKNIARLFNDAGIPAMHVDAKSTDAERLTAIEKLESGEIKIITNCGIMCTGVDIPSLGCIVMARPTKSYNLYIQQMGRGTRVYSGKTNFILLDHAGNVKRHGFNTDERAVNLDGNQQKEKATDVKICQSCFMAFSGLSCPDCRREDTEKVVREKSEHDGELKEITQLDPDDRIRIEISQLKEIAKARGYKKEWVWHQVSKNHGTETARRLLPKQKLPDWVLEKWRQAKNIPS